MSYLRALALDGDRSRIASLIIERSRVDRVEDGKRGEPLLRPGKDIEPMDSAIKHIIPRFERQILYDMARTLRPAGMRSVYHACFIRLRLPRRKILSLGEVRESTKNESRLFSRSCVINAMKV